jgi:hypothetical protein
MAKEGQIGTPIFSYDRFQDVSLADLRIAVDYFTSYLDDTVIPRQDNMPLPSTHAAGVLITCRGEQHTLGWDEFVAVAVPRGDMVFLSSHDRPSIPRRLGIPLLTRKHPLERPPEEYSGQRNKLENINATWLHLDCRTHRNTGEMWGLAPFQWQSNVGNVVVVREDGQDITPRQVEALCIYSQREMGPMFEEAFCRIANDEV